jgi:hypothetical protein
LLGGATLQSENPNTVAAIVSALTHVYGDAGTRLLLIRGLTLADLLDSLLRASIKNQEAIKLATLALGSGDFLVEPEISGPSHISYIYDPPGSLHVVNIFLDTMQGQLRSADIRLRLRDPEAV